MILFTFFFLTSCASGKMIARPEWRLLGVQIDQLDFSKATLGIQAQITNPNSFGVTVRKVHYRLYLKEVLVALGEKKEPFDLPGQGVTDVLLPVEISLGEVRRMLPLLKNRSGKEDLNWRIEGEGTVKAFGLEKVFPFKREESENQSGSGQPP
jgi:LEA14-like dessication related protein